MKQTFRLGGTTGAQCEPAASPAPVPGRSTLVQAKYDSHAAGDGTIGAAPAVQGAGEPMPGPVRQQMEASFGADFSAVRIHQGAQAGAIGARAFTRGNQIHFAPGAFAPDTSAGLELLGHELGHVVQQRQGRVQATTQAKGLPVNDDAGFEHEADVMGARAARGEPVGGPGAGTTGASGDVTQCKLGFEFQTTFTGTGFVEPVEESSKLARVNRGKITYFEADGYKVEGDENDLELVTTAFEETESGFQRMAQVFSKMEVFVESIQGKTIKLSELRHYPGFKTVEKSLEGRPDLALQADSKITADPQTTVGIKLDKLLELGTTLSQARPRQSAFLYSSKDNQVSPTGKAEETTKPTYGSDPQELADHIGWKSLDLKAFQGMMVQAREIVKGLCSMYPDMTDATKGFLFLISAYARGAPNYMSSGKKLDPLCAKFAMPIMSRTNLADLFVTLPGLDKRWFAENYRVIASKMRGQGEDTTLFKATKDDKQQMWEQLKLEFSVEQWLCELIPKDPVSKTPGCDLSSLYESVGDISNVSVREMELSDGQGVKNRWFNDSEKLYNSKDEARDRYGEHVNCSTDIGKATDDGERRTDGVIVELRKLGAKLTVNEWYPFASSVFKLVAMLNQGEERKKEIIDAFIGGR